VCDFLCEGEPEREKKKYNIENKKDKKNCNNTSARMCVFIHFTIFMATFCAAERRRHCSVIDSLHFPSYASSKGDMFILNSIKRSQL